MKNNEKILQLIINNLPGNIYWKDIEGKHLGCNLNNAIAAGLHSPDEILGKTDYELSWKDRADKIVAFDREVMMHKKKVVKEEVIILPGDEEETFFLSQKMPFYEEGKIAGIIGVSLDITELKRVQEELKLALEKVQAANLEREKVLLKYQEFVSNQEHDIRTPIACVVGLSESLVDMLTEPEHLELAKYIHESAKAQKAYQNSLLDGIYLFEEQTESYQRRFDLKSIIDQVKSIYACAFKQSQLNFDIVYDASLPHYLWGDWFRLQQILVCLLSNAVKFTAPGDMIWLRCKGIPKTERDIVLSIEVEDTGIGIASDKLDAIFEPFNRLSLSNLGKYAGRGLGLTFVKKMVMELQGEINVKSVLDKGSVFHLLIPFQQSLSDEPTSEPCGKHET